MIRFSAALVAVAIGVLIGGIATSKLVLVYIAIAVSAVALVALAIGVLLKREELFGEGQGHASAQAGASPVLPAQSGESHDQRPNGLVPPPPSQGAAVGHGAVFAERTPAASAQPEMSWAAPAASDAWATPAAATAAVPAMWQAPPVPADATASGWGAPAVSESAAGGDPDTQGSATAPRAWGTSAPSVFSPRSTDAPAASPGDGAVSGSPNWFNPVEKPVDEDWPTRYSWLDEEPEESSESSDEKSAAAVTVIAGEAALAGDATVPADVVAPEGDESSEDAAEPAVPAALRLVRDPGPAVETAAETADATQTIAALEIAESAEVPGEQEPETEPPATGPDGHAPVDGLVTVVRGVPRFHQEDCVLIRFMPEGDTQKMPAAEAREAGCTPCTACQPEG